MRAFLALLAFLTQAGVQPQHVRIPTPSGVTLDAALVRPLGFQREAAVVALHGCGGPFASRDGSWALLLAHQGHGVLLPDSLGSRGLKSQCKEKHRPLRTSVERRADAIAAAEWLVRQPGVPAGGVDLMGWSNGGNTTLWTASERTDLPPGLFRRFVAFYPGCATASRTADWKPAAPLLILVGANDDWTPAPPCRVLAARYPQAVSLVVYPDAWHDFDAPNRAVTLRTGLATPPGGKGEAHAGTNAAARLDAMQRVPVFLDAAN